MTEKQKRENQMFGMTVEQVEFEFKNTSMCDDRLMFAMAVLSDAQEAMAHGETEDARQWVNKAKYHVDQVRQASRK